MIVSAALGTAAGIPVWYSMRRRKPPISLGVRLAAAWFVGSTGSFLGFTIGGAAAALEVNNHMADSQRSVYIRPWWRPIDKLADISGYLANQEDEGL